MDTEKLIRDIVAKVMSRVGSEAATDAPGPSAGISGGRQEARKVVCGVSVRHLHLCREHVDILFGRGYEMQVLKELYQPGTYAYKETATIVGPRLNAIQNVRVLGPLRDRTQVELAKTDCIILGIDAPVRPSGELSGTASATIIGPRGAVYLKDGVIRANRHLHLSADDAAYYGIKDNDLVDIRISGPKGLTFNNVQVRVSPGYRSEMHVDTDDGNAADIVNGTMAEIVDASCVSPLSLQMANGKDRPPAIPDSSFTGEITDTSILKRMEQAPEKTGPLPEDGESAAENSHTGKKKVITAADLDEYSSSGIEVSGDVILSPLARDEALKRGIKISYRQ